MARYEPGMLPSELLAQEGAWIRYELATCAVDWEGITGMGKGRGPCSPIDPKADCWCAVGALRRCFEDDHRRAIVTCHLAQEIWDKATERDEGPVVTEPRPSQTKIWPHHPEREYWLESYQELIKRWNDTAARSGAQVAAAFKAIGA